MKNQSGRLLIKLTILAIMVMAIYLGFTPLNQANAEASASPCTCYNADHDRMGIMRSGYCDPVC